MMQCGSAPLHTGAFTVSLTGFLSLMRLDDSDGVVCAFGLEQNWLTAARSHSPTEPVLQPVTSMSIDPPDATSNQSWSVDTLKNGTSAGAHGATPAAFLSTTKMRCTWKPATRSLVPPHMSPVSWLSLLPRTHGLSDGGLRRKKP